MFFFNYIVIIYFFLIFLRYVDLFLFPLLKKIKFLKVKDK